MMQVRRVCPRPCHLRQPHRRRPPARVDRCDGPPTVSRHALAPRPKVSSRTRFATPSRSKSSKTSAPPPSVPRCTPIVRAPRQRAICTAALPTAPREPVTRKVSPAVTCAARTTASQAVTNGAPTPAGLAQLSIVRTTRNLALPLIMRWREMRNFHFALRPGARHERI